MRILYTLIFASFVILAQPAQAGVNKTIDAFNGDIEFVMSKVDKSSAHYQSLAALKADFQKTADQSWKMPRYEFYDYASGVYDKMKKISTDAKVPAPSKPDWL